MSEPNKINVPIDEETIIVGAMNQVASEFSQINTTIDIADKTTIIGNVDARKTIRDSIKATNDIITLFQRDTKRLHSIAEKFQELDSEIEIELMKRGSR